MKADHISILKKQLDNTGLNNVCHEIDEQGLINLLKYQNTKIDANTREKSNHTGVGASVQSQKAKLNK